MKFRSLASTTTLLAIGLLALIMAAAVAEARIVSVSTTNAEGIAINDNGTMWRWGGAGSDGLVQGPRIAPGLTNITAVSHGGLCTVVLKDDGTVWAIDTYPVNSGMARPITEPVRIEGLDNITAISGGLVALRSDGTVWIWKDGGVPVRVEGLDGIIAIASNDDHSLALKNDGTVWAWGMNGNGQLGDGTFSYTTGMNIMATGRDTPAPVLNLADVAAISVGDGFSMALKKDGTVWTWGNNYHGELGRGMPHAALPASAVPVQVMGLDHVAAIRGGQYWALALRDDGTVWAWGDNTMGVLGDGTQDSKDAPVQVSGLAGIVDVRASYAMFNLALDKYGAVWAWGHDDGGVLGQRSGYRLWDNGYDVDYLRYQPTPIKLPFSVDLGGPAVEPAWMVSQRPPVVIEDEPAAGGNVSYMAAIGDDTLYAFNGNSLLSIDNAGCARWNFTLPAGWHFGTVAKVTDGGPGYLLMPGGQDVAMPVFMADRDYVYVYALSYDDQKLANPGDTLRLYRSQDTIVDKRVFAISRDGRLEWTYSFSEDVGIGDRAQIEAIGDRVYIYHCYNETVLDRDGNVLFSIDNVAAPVSADENGFIYSMPAIRQSWSILMGVNGSYLDFRTPASALEAYYPNGTRCWHKEVGGAVAVLNLRPQAQAEYGNLPLYVNGTLYVPLKGGVTAYDTSGNVKWSKTLGDGYEMFELMPVDGDGNTYFTKYAPDYPRLGEWSYEFRVLGPDGSEAAQPNYYKFNGWNDRASDGILYMVTGLKSHEKVDYTSLDPVTIMAYDLMNGTKLWDYTATGPEAHTATVSRSNVNAIFWEMGGSASRTDTPGTYSQAYASVTPAGDVLYVNYRASNCPYPVVYGVTECTYASALIALDSGGKPVWVKPMDSFVTATAVDVSAVNNSTIFYNTDKGRIGSFPLVEVAAGLTLLASAALFVKFFLLGGVSRARSRIGKNDNRNSIIALVKERPGSTLCEISKTLALNLGTVRYHLMILGLNHRIVSYNDGKFVRYFTNSGTYSRDDQLVISLARREPMGKIMRALAERDEATNVELADELGIPDSAVSKYLGELLRKGIVVKNPSANTRASYSINSVHVARMAEALRLVEGGTESYPQQAESCA